MEARWRQKPRRGWICPCRAKDSYCPVVEHVYLRERYDEFSWAQLEKDIEINIEINKEREAREATGEKTIHHMQLLETHFKAVAQGIKTVEIRLDDAKRRWIREGDLIEFSNTNDSDSKIVVVVKKKKLFLDFEELVENYDAGLLGFEGYSSEKICEYMKTI